MRKTLLGLAAIAAIATPLAFASSAHAATPGTLDTTTYAAGTTFHHLFAVDYTCGVVGDHAVINFTATADGRNGTSNSGTAAGVLTPNVNGGGNFTFDGTNLAEYTYVGEYNATGEWTDADVTSAGTHSDYGTEGTRGDFAGSVIGKFTGIPTDCPGPEVPATVTGNHGEYVSGAAQAGVKGKDLAAIAKDITKVGPYKG